MKLVRDKLLEKKHREYFFVEGDTFKEFLRLKLYEETHEFVQETMKPEDVRGGFDKAHLIEEAADLLEVIFSLGVLYGFDLDDVEDVRAQKAEYAGGFMRGRVIL